MSKTPLNIHVDVSKVVDSLTKARDLFSWLGLMYISYNIPETKPHKLIHMITTSLAHRNVMSPNILISTGASGWIAGELANYGIKQTWKQIRLGLPRVGIHNIP